MQDIVIPHVVWDQFLPDRVGPLQQFQEDFLDTEDPIPGASVDAPPLPEHMVSVVYSCPLGRQCPEGPVSHSR